MKHPRGCKFEGLTLIGQVYEQLTVISQSTVCSG